MLITLVARLAKAFGFCKTTALGCLSVWVSAFENTLN